MQKLFKKLRENKKGFTLAELLVVVAIIGILVAISIPVFTAQLGKSRRATNNANLRAAKAAAVAEYLTGDKNNGGDEIYTYNIAEGTVTDKGSTDGLTKVEINSADISTSTVYKQISVSVTGNTSGTDDAGTGDAKVELYAK